MLPFSLLGGFISTMNNHNLKSPRKKLPGSPDLCPSDLQEKLNDVGSFTSKSNMQKLDKLIKTSDVSDALIKVEQASSLSLCGKKIALGTSTSSMWQKSYMSSASTGCVEKSTSELVGLLTKQLYLAENQMRRMQMALSTAEEEMDVKDKEIVRLKQKVQECKASRKREQELIRNNKELRAIGRQCSAESAEQLCKKCVKLRSRVHEMEEFLNNYGLTWVGDSNRVKYHKGRSQTLLPKNYIDTYFEQLVACIERLNLSVGKDEVRVRRNKGGGGAYFKSPSCMHLKFYKNGLLIKGGRLRSYNDMSTAKFVRDILDGYFPSEFQLKYPDGVAFKVEDRRAEIFIGHGSEFPGTGYVLGKPTLSRSGSSTNISCYKRCKFEQSPTSCQHENQKSCKQIRHANPSNSPSGSPRTLPQGSPLDSATKGLKSWREQILECQNNCLDSRIQSNFSTDERQSPKKTERERLHATKNVEIKFSSHELKNNRKISNSKIPRRSESPGITPRQLSSITMEAQKAEENGNNEVPSRSRLRSHVSSRYLRQARSLSRSTCVKSSTESAKKTSRSVVSSPRVSKSATNRSEGNAVPLLIQINEPSGKPEDLRLKVRSFNGSTIFLVHLSAGACVEKLYQILDKALSRGYPRSYKILATGFDEKSGNFVKRRLERFGVPLKDYGIETDSVLHLVNDEKRLNTRL